MASLGPNRGSPPWTSWPCSSPWKTFPLSLSFSSPHTQLSPKTSTHPSPNLLFPPAFAHGYLTDCSDQLEHPLWGQSSLELDNLFIYKWNVHVKTQHRDKSLNTMSSDHILSWSIDGKGCILWKVPKLMTPCELWQMMENSCEKHGDSPKLNTDKLKANKQKIVSEQLSFTVPYSQGPTGMMTWVTDTFHVSPTSQLSSPQGYCFFHHQQ